MSTNCYVFRVGAELAEQHSHGSDVVCPHRSRFDDVHALIAEAPAPDLCRICHAPVGERTGTLKGQHVEWRATACGHTWVGRGVVEVPAEVGLVEAARDLAVRWRAFVATDVDDPRRADLASAVWSAIKPVVDALAHAPHPESAEGETREQAIEACARAGHEATHEPWDRVSAADRRMYVERVADNLIGRWMVLAPTFTAAVLAEARRHPILASSPALQPAPVQAPSDSRPTIGQLLDEIEGDPARLCVCDDGTKLHRRDAHRVVNGVLACTVPGCACGPGCIHEWFVDASASEGEPR